MTAGETVREGWMFSRSWSPWGEGQSNSESWLSL